MKWTLEKINNLTREEMIALIEQATNTCIWFTDACDADLRREVISYISKKLI